MAGTQAVYFRAADGTEPVNDFVDVRIRLKAVSSHDQEG
jgi:hypothetical protein